MTPEVVSEADLAALIRELVRRRRVEAGGTNYVEHAVVRCYARPALQVEVEELNMLLDSRVRLSVTAVPRCKQRTEECDLLDGGLRLNHPHGGVDLKERGAAR